MEIKNMKTLVQLNFNRAVLSNCKDITNYGDPREIWDYVIKKYGIYKPLPLFQDYAEFKEAVEVNFLANEYKYRKLFETLNASYNFLKPYDIEEESLLGEKMSKETVQPTGSVKVSNSSTSFDDLSPKLTDESLTSYQGMKTETSYENNMSDTYKNETMSGLTSSSKRKNARTGNIGNHAYADLVEKERKIAYFKLWDEIARDILDLTCYKIFI
ncbi:MAG: hypothetical protein MJZ03_04570 [archaeon]|nr:hypothetical protein [archaeon]